MPSMLNALQEPKRYIYLFYVLFFLTLGCSCCFPPTKLLSRFHWSQDVCVHSDSAVAAKSSDKKKNQTACSKFPVLIQKLCVCLSVCENKCVCTTLCCFMIVHTSRSRFTFYTHFLSVGPAALCKPARSILTSKSLISLKVL